MDIKRPRGTQDVLPKDINKWNYVETLFKKVCSDFGYGEMRTPDFEYTELFKRGVGDTTDIVQKEMFTFEAKSKESITLKPEGTAPVVRAYIENKLYADPQPSKFFYITPCFRYEKPQAGRLRAFHQFGIEIFGTDSSSADAEVISLAVEFFRRLEIDDKIELRINSVGTLESRKEYNKILRDYLKPNYDNLCQTCKDRFEKNPMRIIDCKNETCKAISHDAPLMIDHLDEESKLHFEKLKKYLTAMKIDYTIDPHIVRGLDYYTKSAFEFVSNDIGSQSTVCGGGRYDGLIEELGGPKIPGVGFGLGIERLILLLDNLEKDINQQPSLDVFIASMGEAAEIEAFKILYDLRKAGISCEKDHVGKSIKAQFKYADKLNSRFTIVLGDDEINNQIVTVKDMSNSTQTQIKLDDIVNYFKNLK